MNPVLIISGHPNLDHSVANREILTQLEKALPQAEVMRLDLVYPNYQIDVVAEQNRLLNADTIVLQFPFYWYSYPALLKKWVDDVFVYGFAHGSTGGKLAGKKLLISFTTGAAAEQYQPDGAMCHSIEQFLPAFKQLANLCQMQWLPPVYSNGMMTIPNVSTAEQLALVREKAFAHAARLSKIIQAQN
ncbi:NAD(P)H-dependent oxidoreductase [Avibacterium sp. 20-15]|uniref:NAD(P)H-dependent oxidoreductase n=1 Tax=unclassified Avibacterium TaxID=2685287 RepID=UPI0020269911|nr:MULTISPECIES: NAD(P)H-dependent oxidoreductase [unclassified Avibacterium]MCW9733318.1 NAD(P)H-dependent oxidoreductase [Avibacterium sp. 20-15]URL03192.1 NAD(P)H-dependent oxidoreductase [Avibacterium sp. 20-132]URL06329.1 NAD(P)H-dependent oxidoreductase [Avibacterium sp. 21-595]